MAGWALSGGVLFDGTTHHPATAAGPSPDHGGVLGACHRQALGRAYAVLLNSLALA